MKSENEIPKFDLATQIMAGQRKFAATKRIAPRAKDQRIKTTNEPCHPEWDTRPQTTDHDLENKEPEIQKSLKPEVLSLVPESFPDKIISEIVARDIQNFRKR